MLNIFFLHHGQDNIYCYFKFYIDGKNVATCLGNINENNKSALIHNWRGNILSIGKDGNKNAVNEKNPLTKININKATINRILYNIYIILSDNHHMQGPN